MTKINSLSPSPVVNEFKSAQNAWQTYIHNLIFTECLSQELNSPVNKKLIETNTNKMTPKTIRRNSKHLWCYVNDACTNNQISNQ